jgi:hypothetical protein
MVLPYSPSLTMSRPISACSSQSLRHCHAKKIFLQEQDLAQEARADARLDWAWPHIDHACRQLDPPAGVTKVSRRATRYGAYLALTYEVMVPPKKPSDYRKWAAVRIEALNHALRGLPEERTRYHVCWGSWNGPHAYDVELKNFAAAQDLRGCVSYRSH